MKKIKLIAEIGWNHMGNITLAEKMIVEAAKSGADYAKFQTWRVENLKDGPWDKDGRRQIYEKAELKKEDYKILLKICKKNKIKFLTSLFNEKDYELISSLKLNEIKIPSPENRNKNLLKFCAKKFKTIYLSTGAAKIDEIKNSFKLLKKRKTHIMHCISAYPCNDDNVNLKRIIELKKICPSIGLSDHTPDILSSLFSLPYGVDLIEKHFTVDNKLPGRDNKFAILPKDMKELRNKVDRFTLMEKVTKKLINAEIEVRKIYSGRWNKN
jgi:N,N'-diacetyllegionaminate synthase